MLSKSADSGKLKRPGWRRKTLLRNRRGYCSSNLSRHIEKCARKKSSIGKSWKIKRRNT